MLPADPVLATAPQVEFYFSDSNLPKDKFLKERIASNPEGCELHTDTYC